MHLLGGCLIKLLLLVFDIYEMQYRALLTMHEVIFTNLRTQITPNTHCETSSFVSVLANSARLNTRLISKTFDYLSKLWLQMHTHKATVPIDILRGERGKKKKPQNNEECQVSNRKPKHFFASWPAEKPVEMPPWRGRPAETLRGVGLNYTIDARFVGIHCNNAPADTCWLPDNPALCFWLKDLLIIALKDFLSCRACP